MDLYKILAVIAVILWTVIIFIIGGIYELNDGWFKPIFMSLCWFIVSYILLDMGGYKV